MLKTNTPPDPYTFPSLLKACTSLNLLSHGLSFHQHVLVNGYSPDPYIGSSLIHFYAKLGRTRVARQVFDRMPERNVVPWTAIICCYSRTGDFESAVCMFERTPNKDVIRWTAMISGLVQNKCADKALTLFQKMLLSDIMPYTATIASALAACGQLGSLSLGTSIHAYMLRQRMPFDITAQNSLMTMYVKCNRLVQSHIVFDTMEGRDVVSWNAIVAGYAQNGNLYQSLSFFNEMRRTLQQPDSLTVVSLLQACASIGALHQGKWVHNFVIRSFLGSCNMIDSALVDMYCKCGDLDTARKCFDRISYHDLVPWSAMIAGYGSHGKGDMALEIYNQFLLTGLEPNHVIFLSVLSACNHNGLVNQGLNLFYSMREDFWVEPKLEHLSCIVDLLSRAGRVEQAYDFYKEMFPEPEIGVLGILLDACRMSGSLELGNIIARDICMAKPTDARNYLQVAQSYASVERWDGVSEVWVQMRSLGLRKLPGWSFIELNGTITTFLTQHTSHPQHVDIVQVLKFLSKEMTDLGANFRSDVLNIL
ncbi:hypothetical protein RHMOL_Rhmol13G0199400 [Rhododendron molle]|uniref:Uncharacterized protein n=1 Tax=Rhododendron molle TaxID=49168 RepID=A0ACC0L9M9_RHOML|nr:hypothetical protein RHMOL_Rhmol13G0199400 [Rhododendron molle]